MKNEKGKALSGSWEKALWGVSLAMILMGLSVRIVAFLYNRSLWVDEAMLASSLVQRDYLGLLLPLDYSQGAPIAYLWVTKTLIHLFGSSEYILRLPSLLAGMASVPLFHLVLKKVFDDPRPWIGTAFFATTPFLINYSLEFKPYMLDGMITLISVYLFHLAIHKKIKTGWLMAYCAAVTWVSFPSIFPVAAFSLAWFGWSAFRANKAEMARSLTVGMVALTSFSLYYLAFFHTLEANLSGPFWQQLRFPLVPKGIDDLMLIKTMATHYLGPFGRPALFLVAAMSAGALSLFFIKKYRRVLVFTLTALALLFTASYLGYYGMLNRLLLFLVPLHMLIIMALYREIHMRWRAPAIALGFAIVLINTGSARMFFPDNVYRSYMEINPLVEHLLSAEDQTPVYLYHLNIAQYEYKTGYRMGPWQYRHAEPFCHQGAIYGSRYVSVFFDEPYSRRYDINPVRLSQNVAAIEKYERAYLLLGHCPPTPKEALVDALKKTGTVTEVKRVYDTPLFVYERTKQGGEIQAEP